MTSTTLTCSLLIATCATAVASSLAPAALAQSQSGARDKVVVTGIPISPETQKAIAEIQRTAGGVEVVPDTKFKDSPVQHIKDILGYVPGVIVQPRMGDDARVSIRGSGLSRAYGSRGIAMYYDGMPFNTSDGLLDYFEIDPTAYRYVEVYKGANALRYGSNALGGAVNFVTPTGRDALPFEARIDAGSFGYMKGQASTAGVAGDMDYFVTASAQTIDGYREHSAGRQYRLNGNVGYRFSPDVETRFYLNATSTKQEIPGEVSKDRALNSPKSANPGWVAQDQQRNVDSVRVANKTTARFGQTTVDVGAFYNDRHVKHPIFQWLDYTVDDYGAFVRATDDRLLGGIRNVLIVGANIHNGALDTEQFVNVGGQKGALAASMVDTSENLSFYVQDSLFLRPDVAVIAGIQYLHATREREDRFLSNGDQSGSSDFDLWSPKLGVLWDVDPAWQVFANISRSAEAPSYDTNNFASAATTSLKEQTATTYEIGSRGQRATVAWDLSVYRADIEDELQCLTTGPFSACSPINAGNTVHQGIEAGLDAGIAQSLFADGDSLSLNTAYTFNDFFFDGDPIYGDNELPGVPKQYLRSELLYRQPQGFYAGPNVEWSPESYFADNANTQEVDSYALLNFRVGYDAEAGWSAYLEGRNLTNERYISTVAIAGKASPTSELYNPGTGRSIYGGSGLSGSRQVMTRSHTVSAAAPTGGVDAADVPDSARRSSNAIYSSDIFVLGMGHSSRSKFMPKISHPVRTSFPGQDHDGDGAVI